MPDVLGELEQANELFARQISNREQVFSPQRRTDVVRQCRRS
jgi:hypothetical protein